MKLVLALFSLICAILASPYLPGIEEDTQILNQAVKDEILRYLTEHIKYQIPSGLLGLDKDEIISADIDDFADKIVVNIRDLIGESGYDNISLPDQIGIKPALGSKLNLTEGSLSGLISMQRYQHATLSYDETVKKVSFQMILRFTEIDFIFKYQSQVLFVHSTGHLHGKIEKLKIRVKLGFDFEKSQAFVDDVDVNETGTIKIWLSGNRGIDWLSNAVVAVLTGILHPLILSIVTNVIKNPIQSIVEAINEIIGQFLNPSSF